MEMTVDSILDISVGARHNVALRYNCRHFATKLRFLSKAHGDQGEAEEGFLQDKYEGNKEKQRLENSSLVAEQSPILLPALRVVKLH